MSDLIDTNNFTKQLSYSSKLNVITSNHSGYLELKKKNIKLPSFKPQDTNKLKKLMLNAFNNKKKKNYHNLIKKKFGDKIFLKKIKKFYG